jgi:hypothetical protein
MTGMPRLEGFRVNGKLSRTSRADFTCPPVEFALSENDDEDEPAAFLKAAFEE